jgi:hypothetical protein
LLGTIGFVTAIVIGGTDLLGSFVFGGALSAGFSLVLLVGLLVTFRRTELLPVPSTATFGSMRDTLLRLKGTDLVSAGVLAAAPLLFGGSSGLAWVSGLFLGVSFGQAVHVGALALYERNRGIDVLVAPTRGWREKPTWYARPRQAHA